jgi:hypothetical protein
MESMEIIADGVPENPLNADGPRAILSTKSFSSATGLPFVQSPDIPELSSSRVEPWILVQRWIVCAAL